MIVVFIAWSPSLTVKMDDIVLLGFTELFRFSPPPGTEDALQPIGGRDSLADARRFFFGMPLGPRR